MQIGEGDKRAQCNALPDVGCQDLQRWEACAAPRAGGGGTLEFILLSQKHWLHENSPQKAMYLGNG